MMIAKILWFFIIIPIVISTYIFWMNEGIKSLKRDGIREAILGDFGIFIMMNCLILYLGCLFAYYMKF